MLSRPTTILATLALMFGLVTLPAATAAAETPAKRYAAVAFKQTNQVRVDRDLRPLKGSRCLQRAAIRQAKRMAGQESMFHQAIELLLDGCLLSFVGENVGYGYSGGWAVVRKGWMKSPPHRRNILEDGFTRMGIAARKSDDGVWYVAQVFGTPKS